MITIYMLNILLKNYFQKITNNRIFVYCNNCKYNNKQLVIKCSNCGFSTNNNNVIGTRNISDQLVELAEDENIVATYNFGWTSGIRINSCKLAVNTVLISNTNIFLMDRRLFSKGWSCKKVISIKDIAKLYLEHKKHNITSAPILTIIDINNNSYELFYDASDNSFKYLKNIADCIIELNNNIELITLNERFNK